MICLLFHVFCFCLYGKQFSLFCHIFLKLYSQVFDPINYIYAIIINFNCFIKYYSSLCESFWLYCNFVFSFYSDKKASFLSITIVSYPLYYQQPFFQTSHGCLLRFPDEELFFLYLLLYILFCLFSNIYAFLLLFFSFLIFKNNSI